MHTPLPTLQEVIDHVTDPDNVWDETKFLPSVSFSDLIEDKVAHLHVQYCHGCSFIQGTIGETNIRVFGSHLQGYQIWAFPLGNLFKDVQAQPFVKPARVHPDNPKLLYETILRTVL